MILPSEGVRQTLWDPTEDCKQHHQNLNVLSINFSAPFISKMKGKDHLSKKR